MFTLHTPSLTDGLNLHVRGWPMSESDPAHCPGFLDLNPAWTANTALIKDVQNKKEKNSERKSKMEERTYTYVKRRKRRKRREEEEEEEDHDDDS